jgi:hypothetical protein
LKDLIQTGIYLNQTVRKNENALLQVKDEINNLTILISTNWRWGKTKHPGFGYFSAHECLQFADMHFRHHLRQKKRIDDLLAIDE